MAELLWVGAGGFVGSVARYLLSMAPCAGSLPWATLLTNVVGAVVIGAIAQLASCAPGAISPNQLLFLKVGLCGGFTTFSTFSLETFSLMQEGRGAAAAAYACLSVGLCVAGVAVGMAVVKALRAA